MIASLPIILAASGAVSSHASPWSSAWFDAGVSVIGLAVLMAGWSLILYIAHGHAEKHWCPDPSVHVLPHGEEREPLNRLRSAPSFTQAVPREDQLRSVLRSLRADVQDAKGRISKAVVTSRYWGTTGTDGGPLHDRTWKKNHKQLRGLARMGDLYDVLQEAFGHVTRINGVHFARVVRGRAIKPSDRLEEAEKSLIMAERMLNDKLEELDS